MNMRRRPTIVSPEGNIDERRIGIWPRIVAVLRAEPLLNGIVLAGITIGFFHGWLKVRYPHPVTTFLFDAALIAAFAIAFLRHKTGTPFLLRGRIGSALIAFYVTCAVYALLPFDPPLIVAAASLRAWCFATLMYALGYHMTRSASQVKGYFYVLIILGVITAFYGLQQTPEEIERMTQQDETFAERYKFTHYATGEGGRTLRVFSTFVSSGAFGSVMAFVSIFAVILMTETSASGRERLLMGGALIPMIYALVLSGARSALVMLAVGVAIVGWYRRRRFLVLLIACAAIAVGLRLALQAEGAAAERFSTLLDLPTVVSRPFIPTYLGWLAMNDAPLGHGLGRSGLGVPFFLMGRTGYTDWIRADGDLGCLMIEMGVVGLLVFGRVIWAALKRCYEDLMALRHTPVASIALASGILLVEAILAFPIGSPFLGIPMGAMTWFFVGTLQKLSDEYRRGTLIAVPASETPVPTKRFLHARRENASGKPRFRSRWK